MPPEFWTPDLRFAPSGVTIGGCRESRFNVKGLYSRAVSGLTASGRKGCRYPPRPAAGAGTGPRSAPTRRHPGTCHEMSCSVMRCHVSPPRAPFRGPRRSAAVRILHTVPPSRFRSVRAAAGLPAARPCFARIAWARAPVRAGAVRAPDCPRLCARARRRAHVSRPFRWGFFAPARGERRSGLRMPLPPDPSYHDFTGVKPLPGIIS